MAILVPCACGKKLHIKDELAGKRIRCPVCQAVLAVQAPLAKKSVASPIEPEEEEVPTLEPVDEQDLKPEKLERDDVQFWTSPKAVDTLVVLTEESLYVADLTQEEVEERKEALEEGKSVPKVLKGAKVIVDLDIIRKVTCDLQGNSVNVFFKPADSTEEVDISIACADEDTRDEFLKALRKRLGPEWQRQVVHYTRLRASLPPLGIIAFFGFLTFVFYKAATDEANERAGGHFVVRGWLGMVFYAVLKFLGPWGVVALGALVVIGGFVLLVLQLRNPPIMLTLSPDLGPPKKKKRPRNDD